MPLVTRPTSLSLPALASTSTDVMIFSLPSRRNACGCAFVFSRSGWSGVAIGMRDHRSWRARQRMQRCRRAWTAPARR
jgi:hypothetical protein